MSGAAAVVAVVMLEWTVGWVGAAAWTQSWDVVRRGHFRILGWGSLFLAVVALVALNTTSPSGASGTLVGALAFGTGLYLLAQYARTDTVGAVVGTAAAAMGVVALWSVGSLLAAWTDWTAAVQLVVGALLLGGVTNGMLLGHWYLNQPGLKPWALARLTTLSIGAVVASLVVGALAAAKLIDAPTPGAAIGIPGGDSLGGAFFVVWLALITFTGVVVWMARRCVKIRSIQSATGLYYVAILTAGVSEFLVRYLMINAS
jgi:hypothetical protein